MRLEPLLYALTCAFFTLSSGRRFYGYMMKQTGGEWSAPLDDVFIHFDYARSTAEGHPFEWVVGNGYSSGNTSITYPFVLALGHLVGFRRQHLMLWAALVAATSVFAALLAGRKLFTGLSPSRDGAVADKLASYLLPPMLLSLGALDWTLWSGMEVAFLLLTWGVALVAYLALRETLQSEWREARKRAWWLGAAGALMVLTRPEAMSTIAVFAAAILVRRRRALDLGGSLGLAARMLGPAVFAVLALAVTNRLLTGEWSANGAIVKLAVYNPFMSREAKWDDYAFNFRYEIFRNIEYHFTDNPRFGFIIPALALLAVAAPRTRPAALVLWGQILGWALLVAFNGQVRWQNERYTMPGVAWLLVAAALGASALVRRVRPSWAIVAVVGAGAVWAVIASALPSQRPAALASWGLASLGAAALVGLLWLWPARVVLVIAALGLFRDHQATKMRDQKWFFGRACRNIRDQHIETGRWLRNLKPRRLLVGDAGALVYASERPGLDIIGLGGYHALPFARGGVEGLTATIELMEHLDKEELPDVLAIYPSWWGLLPVWFGRGVIARTPAVGNVICGGYEDVVYLADWHLLGTGEVPRAVPAGLTVRDWVDVADLVSEKEHAYTFEAPSSGFTDLKVLPDILVPSRDVLDGGRTLKPKTRETMRLGHLTPAGGAVLILRAAPVDAATLYVKVNGETLPPLTVHHEDGWIEPTLRIPQDLVRETLDVEIRNDGPGDFVDFHVWVAE